MQRFGECRSTAEACLGWYDRLVTVGQPAPSQLRAWWHVMHLLNTSTSKLVLIRLAHIGYLLFAFAFSCRCRKQGMMVRPKQTRQTESTA
jgi:hypothetical protein